MAEIDNQDNDSRPSFDNTGIDKISGFEERLDRLEKYVALIAEPNAERKDPNRSAFNRIADRMESSGLARVLVITGAALAVFSFAGIVATAWGIRLQYQAMEDDKLARAWQSLATVGLGNAGRAEAIRLIHESGEPLSGINIGGETRRDSAEIPNLTLDSASIGDSDWRNVVLEAAHLAGVHFYRMDLTKSSISGTLEGVDIAWTSAIGSYFSIRAESRLSIDTSVFDGSSFFIRAGRELSGVTTDTDFRVTEDGRVLLDTEEEEKQALVNAGDVVEFRNVSLRCAMIPIRHTVNFRFQSSNLSGAYLGDIYGFDKDHPPEEHYARIPDDEWQKFQGSWYFSDNPPYGIPKKYLEMYFSSFEREKIVAQCKRFEPRAYEKDPFSLLDGADGIETACVSLARNPHACTTPYPSAGLYLVGDSEFDETEKR